MTIFHLCNMRFKNIVFCSPSMITGGAEYYFIRLAHYLAENHKEYKVYYTEYKNGFIYKVLNSSNIEILDYRKGEKTIIPEDSIIFIPSNFIIHIDDMINYNPSNSILSIGFVHFKHILVYFSMDNYYKVTKKYRRKVGNAFEKMTKMGTLFYLGHLGYIKLTQQFLFPHDQSFHLVPIPVPVDKYGIDYPLTRQIGDIIHFCWLGRLDKEKSRNILTYMNELESLNQTMRVSLSLIGLGPEENKLRKKAKKYSFPIEFIGEKRENELDIFIRNNVDIGLASGTSSIEFGLRKVPVIQEWIIDKVYKANIRDTYHLLNEMDNFQDITDNSYRLEGQDYFAKKVEMILKNYHDVCEASYKKAMSKSPEKCGESFVSLINNLQSVDIGESYKYLRKAQQLTKAAWHNWMKILHLRRLYVPICKLLGVQQAVF